MNETPALLLGFGTQLAAGTLVTAGLAVASLAGGLLLGVGGAAARMSRRRLLRAAAHAYTTAVRGVPELLVVLIVYFGASAAIGRVATLFGVTGFFELNPFLAGVTALSLTFGAYATEVLRGAFLAVPPGQAEAASALGLTRLSAFRHVLLPQVWRTALPGLGNLFLVLLKDTSLVSVVGLDELMRKSALAVSYTQRPFTFYLAAAVIYLAMTAVSMAGIQVLERRAARGVGWSG
ncbi:MAG: ABC transporter permease subunit [Deltaproteobacteria bacterium]|nr:ABC transporter permease subunit [Deltaproteobacteria bacterium]